MVRHCFGLLFFLAVTATQTFVADALIIDHHHTDTHLIADGWITQVMNTLHIAYQHTSHGSQIVTGMGALRDYPSFGSRYDFDDSGVPGALDLDDYGIPGESSDLSTGDYIDVNGVTPWVTATRNLLNNPANNHINVIVWSWCSINGHNIPRYLINMEILITEYGPGGTKSRAMEHPVTFVFMTGHAEGQGEGGAVHAANQQIRQHCLTNDRVLFDFADIESYNPDGVYFYDQAMYDNLDYTTAAHTQGNWGAEWIAAHTGSELERLTTGNGVGGGYTGCHNCAHSDSPTEANINCVLKGRAFWWLLAVIAGWSEAGDFDSDSDGLPDSWEINHFGDLSRDGTDDFDEDGYTDYQEYVFDTDPKDDDSKPVALGPDFNLNLRADFTLWRPTLKRWFGKDHLTGAHFDRLWGSDGDIPFTGDFDGDSKTDVGVWRPSIGIWYVLLSSANYAPTSALRMMWGQSGDIPVPGDYDGDGVTDLGVWRPSTGIWYVKDRYGNVIVRTSWGQNGDIPVPEDYDGDGVADLALWRPTDGKWYLKKVDGTVIARTLWGANGDVPVPADFNGDRVTDLGIWRPSTGLWDIADVFGLGIAQVQLGSNGDIPLAGDYDGDRIADLAVFQPGTAQWTILTAVSEFVDQITAGWGANGDLPLGCSPFSALQNHLKQRGYYP